MLLVTVFQAERREFLETLERRGAFVLVVLAGALGAGR